MYTLVMARVKFNAPAWLQNVYCRFFTKYRKGTISLTYLSHESCRIISWD